MATRREMQHRRTKLREQLVALCSDGMQKSGAMLPPVRQLAQQYGVSTAFVSEVVRSLADEGLLYTQKGAGTFVGRMSTRDDLYLLMLPDIMETDPDYIEIRIGIRNGFESSLARLGGTCLTLSRQKALDYQASGHLEGLVGVGEFCNLDDKGGWPGPEPFVALREMIDTRAPGDTVYLDNEDAGRQAAQHLLMLGHRRIGFLGVHEFGVPFAGSLDWSRQRQQGWQSVMEKAGYDTKNLYIGPDHAFGASTSAFRDAGLYAGRELSRLLKERVSEMTAIIVSNANSTDGLFEALKNEHVPEYLWPAVVSFDDYTVPNHHLLSVLRPSWEELGRQAGTLLWERGKGRLDAEPQQRPVIMDLIPRFSCRPRQARVPHHKALTQTPFALERDIVST